MSRALARRAAMLTAAAALITPLAIGTAHAKPGVAATNGKIAYVNNTVAYVAKDDGSGSSPVASAVYSALEWSPDGSRFAYASNDGLKSKRADGSGEVVLDDAIVVSRPA